MLDENGFERDTAPSRWVTVAVWASVPLATLAFGLAVVAFFGVQTTAKERDFAAARLARARQAELAPPRAAVARKGSDASGSPMLPQGAIQELTSLSPPEPARDHQRTLAAGGGAARPTAERLAGAAQPPTDQDEARRLDVHSPPPPTPVVASAWVGSETLTLSALSPTAVEPPVPQRSSAGTASTALPAPPPQPIDDQPAVPVPDQSTAGEAAFTVPVPPTPPVLPSPAIEQTASQPSNADVAAFSLPATPMPSVPPPPAIEAPAPRWTVTGTVSPSHPASPTEPIADRRAAPMPGHAVPASLPPRNAEVVRGLAPAVAGIALDREAAAARAPVVAVPPAASRVFIHQPTSARDGVAEAVARRLGRHGVTVAAIRPVRATPSAPEIRYFHADDRAAALNLARQLGGQTWRVRDFLSYAKPPRPGTLEIWLPGGMVAAVD